MFQRLRHSSGARLTFTVNGRMFQAEQGDTVAAALLVNGIPAFRTTAMGALRGPWCMMGACQDCRISIDGLPGRQACQIEIRDGMAVSLDLALPGFPG